MRAGQRQHLPSTLNRGRTARVDAPWRWNLGIVVNGDARYRRGSTFQISRRMEWQMGTVCEWTRDPGRERQSSFFSGAAPFFLALVGLSFAGLTASDAADDRRPESSETRVLSINCSRIEGSVSIGGSGDPVVGATVIFIADGVPLDGEVLTVSAVTGADGTFLLKAPYGLPGTVQMIPPVGFQIPSGSSSRQSVLSGESEDAALRFEVEACPVVEVSLDSSQWQDVESLQCVVYGPHGHVSHAIRQPGGRTFSLSLFSTNEESLLLWTHDAVRLIPEKRVSYTAEPGFRPGAVAKVESVKAGEATVVDDQGKVATFSGFKVSTSRRALTLGISLPPPAGTPVISVKGTVLDAQGAPVQAASVVISSINPQLGLFENCEVAQTDDHGRFETRSFRPKWLRLSDFQVQAVVRLAEEELARSAPVSVSKEGNGSIDLGTLRPATGIPLSLRIVDVFGARCPGATVKVFSADGEVAGRFVANARGELQTRELSSGEYQIVAISGDFVGRKSVVLTAQSGGTPPEILIPLTHASRQIAELSDDELDAPSIEIGDPVGELQGLEWTDRLPRTLESFRGRVVVLFFWNKDLPECEQMISTLESTRQKYQNDPVVFLGIHPHGEPSAVRAFMAKQDWDLPTGIESTGSDSGSGEVSRGFGLTSKEYEVPIPLAVVIGKSGRLSCSPRLGDGAAELLRMFKVAEELGIDLVNAEVREPEEEGCAKCSRIQASILSRAIDSALVD